MTKASLGGGKTGPNPTNRGKVGTTRSLLVDARGMPLAVVVSSAQTPDGRLLGPTLAALQTARPGPETTSQHLLLDKGHAGTPCTTIAAALRLWFGRYD